MIKRKNIVGKLINFRGLVYAPVEENGVIFLFSKLNEDINLNVETVRKGFPDCIAKRKIGADRWEEVLIEFEFKSSDFKRHRHLESMGKGVKCDMIVCWEHDWKDCPKEIEVLELKSEYRKYDNYSEEEPEKESKSKEVKRDLIFKNFNASRQLFEKFNKAILTIDKTIWMKEAKWRIFYYSPERVFFNLAVQKKGLKLILFTGGKHIKGVEPVSEEGSYAQKWGVLYISSKEDIPNAKRALSVSLKRIREAFRKNENTGWYAEVE